MEGWEKGAARQKKDGNAVAIILGRICNKYENTQQQEEG
jgi:hypothetical protein